MKPSVYIASQEDKKKAERICFKIISVIEKSTDDLMFKAYVMQMLIESFEETFNINIRQGISIKQNKNEG